MAKKLPVAYFSNEFAIDSDLPTYAGGLGVLAGDLMFTAAFKKFPMIGIGILYKGTDFVQHITGDGKEEKKSTEFDHDTSFLKQTTIDEVPVVVTLPSPDGEVKVKVYELCLSNVTTLYFLSTDIDGNPQNWVKDMDRIYAGDTDSQIRQQILLGVGGARVLKVLGVKPKIFHLNEGRAGFVIWELVKEIMEENVTFEKAWEMAKAKIVYTNHTLVSAGNPSYDLATVTWWADPYAKEIGVDTKELIKDGVVFDKFSITDFALNVSAKQSAVSDIHRKYAEEKYPDYDWISVTNGVHMLRWQDSDFRDENISDKQIWDQHQIKKQELVETVIKRTGFGYDPSKLVISWARRLAEYKQPKIIFSDLERLKRIVSRSDCPVQILFAGNSHSADIHSKRIVEELIELFSTELVGHAIFVPDYNIALANHLTSGSDVWLNTPKGNLEACGTSGMKAIANGVINCTVLDGWTYEVDWKDTGWVLDPDNVSENFYDLLENEIVPEYFERNNENIPERWIKRMRNSIKLATKYSSQRMLSDYDKLLYR